MGNVTFMFLTIGVFGFLLIPIVGVGYTFMAMNFLPISPAASCGIAHIGNAAVSFGLAEVASIFVEDDGNAWYALIVMGVSGIIAVIAGCLSRENASVHDKKTEDKTSVFSVSFSFDSG